MKILKSSQLPEFAAKSAQKALAQRDAEAADSKNFYPPVVVGMPAPAIK